MPPTITVKPDFGRLMSLLNNTRVQAQNPALWQFLSQFVQSTTQSQDVTGRDIADAIESIETNDGQIAELDALLNKIANASIITEEDETAILALSRKLVAGTNILLDTTTAGQIVISGAGTSGAPSTVETYITVNDESLT